MDKRINLLSKAQVIPILKVNSGYLPVEMDDKVADKTTFATHHVVIRYTRIPFRLVNAPATFQKVMGFILASLKRQSVVVYITTSSFFQLRQQHLYQIAEVQRLLMHTGLTLKSKNCHFFSKFIDYLGHSDARGKL